MAAIPYARSVDPSRQLSVLPSDVEAAKQEVNAWYFFAQARGGLDEVAMVLKWMEAGRYSN
jgi:hypothetical protein